jgi:hypothetical protein
MIKYIILFLTGGFLLSILQCKTKFVEPFTNQFIVGKDSVALKYAYLIDYGVVQQKNTNVYSKTFIISSSNIENQNAKSNAKTILLRTYIEGSKFKTGNFKLDGSGKQYASFLYKEYAKNKEISLDQGDISIEFKNDYYLFTCKATNKSGQEVRLSFKSVFVDY